VCVCVRVCVCVCACLCACACVCKVRDMCAPALKCTTLTHKGGQQQECSAPHAAPHAHASPHGQHTRLGMAAEPHKLTPQPPPPRGPGTHRGGSKATGPHMLTPRTVPPQPRGKGGRTAEGGPVKLLRNTDSLAHLAFEAGLAVRCVLHVQMCACVWKRVGLRLCCGG